MQETIDLLLKYGYILLFLYSLGGGFVALVAACVLSSMGKMDLYLSLSVAILGNFLGDALLFYLARYQKKEMMPYLSKHKRKLAYTQLLMRRYGSLVLIIQKYIYGFKTLVPLGVALTNYNFSKFNFYNLIGAILWGFSIGLGSYFLSEVFLNSLSYLQNYPFLAPIILFTLLLILWIFLSKATTKKFNKNLGK
ncbi:DedA family protein [Helicobacter burdigaliensis]|uniref:DedA family protein n=1 Tax=Helicobacter burdigaliensis TaxID=2315334 RepID=UPI000EF6A212|nr:DedA family protein [Helicobacter burdigaliensis]